MAMGRVSLPRKENVSYCQETASAVVLSCFGAGVDLEIEIKVH